MQPEFSLHRPHCRAIVVHPSQSCFTPQISQKTEIRQSHSRRYPTCAYVSPSRPPLRKPHVQGARMTARFTHRRRVKMDELYAKTFAELTAIAAAQNIIVQSNISKWELVVQILRSAFNTGAQLSVEGVLQIQPLGFGMIKSSTSDPIHPSNVYIAPFPDCRKRAPRRLQSLCQRPTTSPG